MEAILKEVLLVTGWFFVWEAVENFVSNRRTQLNSGVYNVSDGSYIKNTKVIGIVK